MNSLERCYNFSTTTFKYKDYFVDVVVIIEDPNDIMFESYLYHESMGVKDLMFDMHSKDVSYREFLDIILDNIEEYIESYNDDYF